MANRTGHLELSISLPTWYDEPTKPASWVQMRDLAQQAEAIGVDAIFVADQTNFDLPDAMREFWDGWTLLPALAESTRTVALGAFVTAAHLRHPVALARMASTLDEVSGGRVILGLGASDAIERAWRVSGVPTDRLFSRFVEAIDIIAPLLRTGAVDYHGEYYQAHGATLGPAAHAD